MTERLSRQSREGIIDRWERREFTRPMSSMALTKADVTACARLLDTDRSTATRLLLDCGVHGSRIELERQRTHGDRKRTRVDAAREVLEGMRGTLEFRRSQL